MESKRKNIYIVIFVITTIIAACAAVYFGVKYIKEKENLENEINELKKENIEIHNSIENINKENKGPQVNSNSDENKNEVPSQEDVKKVTTQFLNLRALCFASSENVLINLKYYNDIKDLYDILKFDGNGYQTDINYFVFKDKMLNYMIEELFLVDNVFDRYINRNSLLYIQAFGASGGEYTVNNVKLTTSSENRFEYEFNGTYNWAEHDSEITGKVVLKLVNSKLVVDNLSIDQKNVANDRLE